MKAFVVGFLVCLAFGSIRTTVSSWVTAAFFSTPGFAITQTALNGSEVPALAVTINVMDANTKQPLKSILIVPALAPANAKQVTWQSQYLKKPESVPATFEGLPETAYVLHATVYRKSCQMANEARRSRAIHHASRFRPAPKTGSPWILAIAP